MPDNIENLAISNVDPSEAFVVDTAQDPVEETPKVDPIAELSKANGGIDLSGFTDEGAAKTYISKLTHLFAEAGQRALTPAPQSGQFDYLPQSAAEVEDDPLELEEVEDPPVSTKRPPKATKREKELERRLATLETQHRQTLERQIEQQNQSLAAEARNAVDGLKSDTYGVAGNRNFDQQIATRVLLERAIAIANGAPQFGFNIGLADAIRMVAGQSGKKVATEAKKETAGLEPRGAGGPLPGIPNKTTIESPGMGALPHGSLTSYTRDPAFLAAVKSLARR